MNSNEKWLFICAAAVAIFLIGTCGDVFTKTAMERCAESCAGRMSKWSSKMISDSRPEQCECLERK